MRSLGLARGGEPLTVLCLGAHCDDVEIGCGGTLLWLAREAPRTRFHWMVLCADAVRGAETRASAGAFLAGCDVKLQLESFRDGFLPAAWGEVKEAFERLKAEVQPDVIFAPHRGDLHQDHRVVAELTWNTFRDHVILEYEIPKYEGDLGTPNFFVPLDERDVLHKWELLDSHYASQRDRTWFREDTFRGLMKLRGIECNAPGGYAEAFHGRKLVWGEAP